MIHSDAENERARTAHTLFAEQDQGGGFGTNTWWHSSDSQSIDIDDGGALPPDERERHVLASRHRGCLVSPLTPASSPPRSNVSIHDKDKKCRLDHSHATLTTTRPFALDLDSPIQLSPVSGRCYSTFNFTAASSNTHATIGTSNCTHHSVEPLADLHNFLAKKPLPSSSSRRPTPSSNPDSARKRRRLEKTSETLVIEHQRPRHREKLVTDSPMPTPPPRNGRRTGGPSDWSSKTTSTFDHSVVSTSQTTTGKQSTLLSPPSLTSRLPVPTNNPLSLQSRASSSVSIDMASSSSASTRTERLHIANKLSRARPDLVAPCYLSKRARQLSWSMKLETREQYLQGLRSISRTDLGDMPTRDTTPHDNLPLEDNFDVDGGMDWDRSRLLTQIVKAQLDVGEQITLPTLACLDSQPRGV